MRRKGFIFTLDALLSIILVSIIVIAILASQSQVQSVYKTYMRGQSKKTASDTLIILRTVPLNQLVPEEIINEWIDKGILNESLVRPDMTPLDIAATYWAVSPSYRTKFKENAAKILGYILNSTLDGYNYELLINNWTSPFMTKGKETYSLAEDVSAATIALSGYAYNQTPRGYVTRAFLSKIQSRRTTISQWGILASTPSKIVQTPSGIRIKNPARITYTFELPSDAQVLDAKLVLEPLWAYSIVNVTVNEMPYSTNQRISEVMEYDLTNLINGTNKISLSILRPPEGGDDGATHSFAEITTNQTYNLFKKKIYLPEIRANGPIKCQIPVYMDSIPNSIYLRLNLSDSINEIHLYLGMNNTEYYLGNKTNSGGVFFSWQDIQNGLSSNGLSVSDIVGKPIYFIIEADPYFITSPTSEEKVIYGTSYLYVDYSPPAIPLYMIPITVHLSGSGELENSLHKGFFRNVTYSFTIPSGATPVENKYIFSWFYSIGWNPYSNITINTNPLYSTPPQFMLLPLTRFKYHNTSPVLIPGDNNVFSAEFGQGYYVNPEYSYGELTYLVHGFVPYGKTFEKAEGSTVTIYYDLDGDNNPDGHITIQVGDNPSDVFDPDKDAVDDALVRLLDNLNFDRDKNPDLAVPLDQVDGDGSEGNPIDIYISPDIKFTSVSLQNIPRLTSPILITLRIWREGQ